MQPNVQALNIITQSISHLRISFLIFACRPKQLYGVWDWVKMRMNRTKIDASEYSEESDTEGNLIKVYDYVQTDADWSEGRDLVS